MKVGSYDVISIFLKRRHLIDISSPRFQIYPNTKKLPMLLTSISERRHASSASSWTEESAWTFTVPLETKNLEMVPSAPVTDTL